MLIIWATVTHSPQMLLPFAGSHHECWLLDLQLFYRVFASYFSHVFKISANSNSDFEMQIKHKNTIHISPNSFIFEVAIYWGMHFPMEISFNKKVPCNGLVKTVFASVSLQMLSYPSWVLLGCKLFMGNIMLYMITLKSCEIKNGAQGHKASLWKRM